MKQSLNFPLRVSKLWLVIPLFENQFLDTFCRDCKILYKHHPISKCVLFEQNYAVVPLEWLEIPVQSLCYVGSISKF